MCVLCTVCATYLVKSLEEVSFVILGLAFGKELRVLRSKPAALRRVLDPWNILVVVVVVVVDGGGGGMERCRVLL